MAHYRHLPVWKAAMDLAVQLEPCGSGGSRKAIRAYRRSHDKQPYQLFTFD